MIGNTLLAFFIAMPAVVMFAKRNTMRHSMSRQVMTWGGGLAVLLALIVVLPLLACKGSMLSGYGSCFGGAGLSQLVAGAQPMIILAGKLYILLGVPLALLTFALDRAR